MDHPDENEHRDINIPQQHQNNQISGSRQRQQTRQYVVDTGVATYFPPGSSSTSTMSSQFIQSPSTATTASDLHLRRRYHHQIMESSPGRLNVSNPPLQMEYHHSPMHSNAMSHHQQQQQQPYSAPLPPPNATPYALIHQHHQQQSYGPPHVQSMYQQHQHQQSGTRHHQAHTSPQQPPQHYRHIPHPPPQQMPIHQASIVEQQQSYFQSMPSRSPRNRPLFKLSVSLIDTYKRINKVYYQERNARKKTHRSGVNNDGWDDENYDYIIVPGEVLNDRYIIEDRIGKGSFGQVVRAVNTQTNEVVAIKIIKSKKPFLMQAKTEVDLLSSLVEKADQNNIVRLIEHFLFRNHQCLIFEMLSLNLYELLKSTKFCGISLSLIKKFAKQILKALAFLARPEIDIIHCDLKPENILLKHPKRSGIKVIDFGSSCKSNKRMYSYIQSRFYRSPEVMLGLPYTVSIDIWSLGCILVEMHTGEPLFSGSDQFDQMQKIVRVLGMLPASMINRSSDQHRLQFFQRGPSMDQPWIIKQIHESSSQRESSQRGSSQQKRPVIIPSQNPILSLTQIVGGDSAGKEYMTNEPSHTPRTYDLFVDLIYRMLSYDPQKRIKPEEALRHPFITEDDVPRNTNTTPLRNSINMNIGYNAHPSHPVEMSRHYRPSNKDHR